MWLFDKINQIKQYFLNRKNNIKPLPEAQQQPYNDQPREYTFQRDDGTTIQIRPILDRVGNQGYQQIFNRATGQMQCIPLFSISTDQIKAIYGSEMARQSILMDIDPSILENQECSHYIANELLSDTRISKIMTTYQNYAGGINRQEDGTIGRYMDEGVIQTLRSTKEENRMAVEEARKREIRENAQNIQCEYKTSHAEDLSK